jgi:hypothetical protein
MKNSPKPMPKIPERCARRASMDPRKIKLKPPEELDIEIVTEESLRAEINLGGRPKWTNEQREKYAKNPNAGRPKGSRNYDNCFSDDAKTRMKKLNFDPLDEMIKVYDDIEMKIRHEEGKKKPSTVYLAALLSLRNKTTADLLKFGYRPLPLSAEQEREVKPIMIGLMGQDDVKPLAGVEEFVIRARPAIGAYENAVDGDYYEEN